VDAERIDRLRQAAETSSRAELPVADASAHGTGGQPDEPADPEPADPEPAADAPAADAPHDHDLATAALAEFLRDGLSDEKTGRVDVRKEPLAVRDGCGPDRIPAGRWPSDDALVRSEQFAVNEAIRQLADPRLPRQGALLAVHAPPGTGVAEVFGDLAAAIITERARRIADLPDPAAAFGESRIWGAHTVAAPARALTGFEIVLAAPESSAPTAYGLPPIGTRWREEAARIDYFASTARLADGVGAWAMLVARLGDAPANRAFAERWWRGTVRGTDVLFPAGESMAAALRRLQADREAVDWPAAVTRFRSAAARAESLAEERARVAASLTRLSALEQACEEASGTAEAGQTTLADLTAREPSVRESVADAEDDRRTRLAGLGAHELDRPALTTVTEQGRAALRTSSALSIAVSGGLRRGRNWRNWSVTRRELRAACAKAERRRDAAVRASEALRASLAAARQAVALATVEVTRLAAELGPLAEEVAVARQRWGDHVPDGPSQAETEDAALIEWRETSAPWADTEYAAARADVFLAALDLHKALIAARADVFAANLGALMDLLCAEPPQVPAARQAMEGDGVEGDDREGDDREGGGAHGASLAAWQSFFLVVPVIHVPFEAAGTLVGGVGQGSLGWLLAGGAERLSPRQARGILGHVDHAVLAGDTIGTLRTALAGDSAQRIAERITRYGTWLPSDSAEPTDSGPAEQAGGGGRTWVGTPLRVVRGLDRATVDLRNDLGYDGLLISDRD
jgi:hypothetical protein